MAKKIVCPNRKCKSVNVVPITTDRKLSVGKGLLGGALFGPLGAVDGAAIGKNGKTKFRCADCGTVFEVKL